MAFHNIPLFRELVRSLRINPGDEPPLSVELTRELKDLRKITLNFVCVFCVRWRHPELKCVFHSSWRSSRWAFLD